MVDLACRSADCSEPFATIGVYMHTLVHWFASYASVLAILDTLGVAVLLVCCLECTNCPSREKDDIFSRHEL